MVKEKCVPSQPKATCEQDLQNRYLGNGSRCPEPESEKGACCADGQCGVETLEACNARKATFLADVKTCDPNPCPQPPPPKGGCCDIYGSCQESSAEADCLAVAGSRFFYGGCPETCPVVEGACFMPCPTKTVALEDCLMMSLRECMSISKSRFRLNEQCPDTKCVSCYSCKEVFGEWILSLPDETVTLTLNSDCTSTMVTERRVAEGATDLPIRQSLGTHLKGSWACSGSTIVVAWPDYTSTFVVDRQGATPKLCTQERGKTVCATQVVTAGRGLDEKPPPEEVFVKISIEGKGASPHWGGASYIQSGYHEEIFRLKRGQDLRTELRAYVNRLAGVVCKIVTPPGMISKDRPPQIWERAVITVLDDVITDAKQLKGVELKESWKTIKEDGPSLPALRKAKGCE